MYFARDVLSRRLFVALKAHCRGDVLDVGGWDFYLTAMDKDLSYRTWTTLENDAAKLFTLDDPRFRMEIGDGCAMAFPDASFDTVLSLQVLEHVFHPLQMMHETARVLRPGGACIVLAPQTGNLHLLPHHYTNFTKFWFIEAAKTCDLDIVDYHALGGAWSTLASRFFFIFVQSLRGSGNTYDQPRKWLFYILLPAALAFAALCLPVCLLFSIADLEEEPNNHLFVLRKKI